MADEGYGRDFPGNPNPNPQPPRVSTTTAPGAPETTAAPTSVGATAVAERPVAAALQPDDVLSPKASFRVVNNDNGRREVFMQTDDLETTKLGSVNIPGADVLLNTLGTYNTTTQTWDVPEKVARELMAGEMPLPDYIPAKYRANKAVIANGLIWTDYLHGKISLAEAQGRGDIEQLKMQVKEAPLFVWQGNLPKTVAKMWTDLKEAGSGGVARRVAGETAGLAAFTTDAPMVAAAGMTMAATIVASESVSGGLATPAVAAGVAFALERGADALVFQRSREIEGGNAASEMIQKGYSEEAVKKLAPLVGVVNGALEVAGFHMLPAPYKRVLASKLLAAPVMRKTLANAYIKFMGELGTEISTEVAQEMMNVYAENLANGLDAKPDALKNTSSETLTRVGDIALRTLAGAGGVKIPGLVAEVRSQRTERANTQAEIKAQEEMTARLAARGDAPAPIELGTISPTEMGGIPGEAAPGSRLPSPEIAPATGTPLPATERGPSAPPATPSSGPELVAYAQSIALEARKNKWGYGSAEDVAAAGQIHPDLMAEMERVFNPEIPHTPEELRQLHSTIDEPGGLLRHTMESVKEEMLGQFEMNRQLVADPRLTPKAAARQLESLTRAVKRYVLSTKEALPADVPGLIDRYQAIAAQGQEAAPAGVKSEAEQLAELGVQAAGGKISPDELVAQSDKLMSQAPEEPAAAGAKRPAPQSFEGKTREVESKARVQALTHDLADVRTLLKSYEQTRERFLRNEMSTRLLDKQIDALITREDAIKADITFYEAAGKEAAVTPGETLSMKPATLENIVQVGFKEGRKEVIAVRAQQIKDIASRLELTQADIRLLLKDKNIGLMGDVEFRHFLDGFENAKGERVQGFKQKAAEHLKRKLALKDVRKTLKERQIKNEKNIRALHELPPAGKMTTKQLHDYVDILSEYEPGAIAITPKRVAALETSALKGAKTEQDIVRLAAGDVRVTPEEILSAQRGQFDPLRGDTELAESQPAYAFMVDQVQTAKAESDAKFQKFERENYKLGAAALASRGGIARRLVTTMPEVMAHLEADPGKVYTGEISLPDITPEEQAYVEFLRGFFTEARDYLFSTGELESTRFKDIYAPHLRRPVLEVLSQVRSAKELRAGLGEIVDGWMAAQKQTAGVEAVGPAVGLRQFFKQTLFRTGELTPSTNVIRSANSYAKQFYDKQAIDKALPVVDSLFRAVAALQEDQTKEGEMTQRAVRAVVADYLNNKKGIQAEFTKLAPRGGYVDLAVRLLSSWVTMKSIAFNLPLQITAPIGETAAAYALLQKKRFAKANIRLYSEQGRKIAEKYESFVGKGALDEVLAPGKNIDERALSSLFAILQWNRTRTLKTVLLGMMTDEEFAAGEISAKRLAEIKVTAGRLLDIPGLKSVVGSTSLGAGYTKFRGWLIPILRTTANDLQALMTPGRKMTQQEVGELMAIAETTLFGVGVIAAMGSVDDDDKTFVGQLRKKVAQEVLTLVSGWDPAMLAKWIAGGPIPQHVIQVGHALSLLVKLDEYKTGEKAGKLKGVEELKKTLPFAAAARQFKTEEK